MRRVLIVIVAAAGALSIAPALAGHIEGHEHEHKDLVVLTGGTRIGEDELLHYVVVFHGDVTVEGRVNGQLLVFDGNVTVSGLVEGDLIVFQGDVTIASGGGVYGDVAASREPVIEEGGGISGEVHVPARDIGWRTLVHSMVHALGLDSSLHPYEVFSVRLPLWIATTGSLFLLGALLLWLAPRGMDSVAATWASSKGSSILWGFILLIGLPLGAVLAIVAVIGVPFGVGITLLALGLLYSLGYVAGAWGFGRSLVAAPRSRWVAFLTGFAILRLVGLILFVGGIVSLVTTVAGLGLLAVTIWRSRGAPAAAAA